MPVNLPTDPVQTPPPSAFPSGWGPCRLVVAGDPNTWSMTEAAADQVTTAANTGQPVALPAVPGFGLGILGNPCILLLNIPAIGALTLQDTASTWSVRPGIVVSHLALPNTAPFGIYVLGSGPLTPVEGSLTATVSSVPADSSLDSVQSELLGAFSSGALMSITLAGSPLGPPPPTLYLQPKNLLGIALVSPGSA